MNLVEKCYKLVSETTDELFKLLAFKSDSISGYKLKQASYEKIKAQLESEFKEKEGKNHLGALDKIRAQVKLAAELQTDPAHFETTIKHSVLIYSCSIFDFFLSKTTEYLIENNPKTLATNKKSITYDKILTEGIEKIISNIIEREVYEISYKKIEERIKIMSEKFDLDIEFVESQTTFFGGKLNIDLLKTAFAYRNLILHHHGVVNKYFLDIVKNPTYNLGDTVTITDELLYLIIMTLIRSETNIYRQIEIRYWE